MTKLLEQAIATVRTLSDEDQGAAADALFAHLADDHRHVALSPEQVEDVNKIQRALLNGQKRLATDTDMGASLKTAIAEVSTLPAAAQQKIGRDLLTYVEKLRWLQAEIDKGFRNLDAGEGRELDIEAFLQEMHERHACR